MAVCIFINSDIFYDTLRLFATFKVKSDSLVRNREKQYFEKGAITLFWVVICRSFCLNLKRNYWKCLQTKIIIKERLAGS